MEQVQGFNQMAQREWMSRPDDERYEDLATMRAAVQLDTDASHERNGFKRSQLRVIAGPENGLALLTPDGQCPTFSNWSFGQTCRLAGAPANYLASLPATTAAECLNYGLRTADADASAVAYIKEPTGGVPTLRALTSDKYSRFRNLDLLDGLIDLSARGWVVPPGWAGKPSGLYYSDRSMFAYMIDDATRSIVTHPDAARREDLARGFFLWNSEEGAASFGLCAFFFRFTCGNHGVWGVSAFTEIRMRHVGDSLRYRIGRAMRSAADIAGKTAADDMEAIRWAMGEKLTLDSLPSKSSDIPGFLAPFVHDRSRGKISEPMAARAISRGLDEGENVRTVWGVVQGFTSLARDAEYRDRADDLMRAPLALLPAKGRRPNVVTLD